MSAFSAEDGSPAVSSEDFRAALDLGPAPDTAPVAPDTQPAPKEATPPDSPATPPVPAPDEETAPPDELTTLKARLAAIEAESQRRERTYSANVQQQREALQAAQRERDTYAQRARDWETNSAKAEEDRWQQQVAGWRQQVANERDPQNQQYLQGLLTTVIREHEAETKLAQANAKEQQLAPVMQQLGGLQQMATLQQFVGLGVQSLQTAGADQLAAEVGVPADEVRAYLARPQIVERLQRALAHQEYSRQQGLPIPTTFVDLGEQIKEHFADLAAARSGAEERLIAGNQGDLVRSGATRGDGGGGAGSPARQINTMADVTTDDWLRALRGEPVRGSGRRS